MAKELTFEQVKRNGGAVQLDQRLAAAWTGIVDCVSYEFLASSGFSVNEYRRIRRCDALDLFQNEFQGRATADDLLESPGPTVLFNHSHSFDSNNLRELIL
jgi:hypothetical protein